MTTGFAATEAGGKLKEFQYDLGPLGDHQVDVKVDYCGICYSDLSMIDNHWGWTLTLLYRGMKLSEPLRLWVLM